MMFVCDRMLGTLAKWMRLFGFNVLYPEEMDDKDLKILAIRECRVLLTRDKQVAQGKDVLYLDSDVWEEQFKQVAQEYDLEITDPLSRCSLCNSPIDDVPNGEVQGNVPDQVYELQEEFWYCKTCDKYYWRGTHWDGIIQRMKDLD